VQGGLSLAMTSNAIGALDDRSYRKTREISTLKSDGKLGSRLVQPPDCEDTVCNLRKTLAVNPEDHSLFADPDLTTAE
jgi:hypothetical protein